MLVAFLTDFLFSKIVAEAFFEWQPRFFKPVERIKILVGKVSFLQQKVEPFFWDTMGPDILKITINMRECLLVSLCLGQFVQIADQSIKGCL